MWNGSTRHGDADLAPLCAPDSSGVGAEVRGWGVGGEGGLSDRLVRLNLLYAELERAGGRRELYLLPHALAHDGAADGR